MPSPCYCRDRRGCIDPRLAAGVLTIARGLRTARLWLRLPLWLRLRLLGAALRSPLSDGAASCRGGARGLGAQARGRDPPRTNTEVRGLWARGATANQTRRPNSLAPAGFLTRDLPERRSPRLPGMLVNPGARARSSN